MQLAWVRVDVIEPYNRLSITYGLQASSRGCWMAWMVGCEDAYSGCLLLLSLLCKVSHEALVYMLYAKH